MNIIILKEKFKVIKSVKQKICSAIQSTNVIAFLLFIFHTFSSKLFLLTVCPTSTYKWGERNTGEKRKSLRFCGT